MGWIPACAGMTKRLMFKMSVEEMDPRLRGLTRVVHLRGADARMISTLRGFTQKKDSSASSFPRRRTCTRKGESILRPRKKTKAVDPRLRGDDFKIMRMVISK